MFTKYDNHLGIYSVSNKNLEDFNNSYNLTNCLNNNDNGNIISVNINSENPPSNNTENMNKLDDHDEAGSLSINFDNDDDDDFEKSNDNDELFTNPSKDSTNGILIPNTSYFIKNKPYVCDNLNELQNFIRISSNDYEHDENDQHLNQHSLHKHNLHKHNYTSSASPSLSNSSLLSPSSYYENNINNNNINEFNLLNSSDNRNIHCVKEKMRRDRIKFSCNELRRLIPNMSGIKTDMASLLETSVIWIQLINSNIPEEYLNDIQNKLIKMTTSKKNTLKKPRNTCNTPKSSMRAKRVKAEPKFKNSELNIRKQEKLKAKLDVTQIIDSLSASPSFDSGSVNSLASPNEMSPVEFNKAFLTDNQNQIFSNNFGLGSKPSKWLSFSHQLCSNDAFQNNLNANQQKLNQIEIKNFTDHVELRSIIKKSNDNSNNLNINNNINNTNNNYNNINNNNLLNNFQQNSMHFKSKEQLLVTPLQDNLIMNPQIYSIDFENLPNIYSSQIQNCWQQSSIGINSLNN